MTVYVGVDAGGTKTRLAAFDTEGKLISEAVVGTVHPLQVSPEEAAASLKNGLQQLKLTDPDIRILAGMAGYGKDARLREAIEKSAAEAFAGLQYVLMSDAELALHSAFNGKDGILLIAGTGSIAFGKKGDEILRCGGWGSALGDEGSAWWVGKQLLNTYTRQADGRDPETVLKPTVEMHFDLQNPYDLISKMPKDRTQTAALAKLVSDLSEMKDPAAGKIFDLAALQLAELCNSLGAKYDRNVEIAQIGGLWKAGEAIQKPFKAALNENLSVKEESVDPARGAYVFFHNE